MEGPAKREGMNEEYFNQFIEASKKARQTMDAVQEAQLKATEASTAVMEAWGQVWPLEARLKELRESDPINEAELAEVLEQYDIALKTFEEKERIANPITEDLDQKRVAQKTAFDEFREIQSKLMGK